MIPQFARNALVFCTIVPAFGGLTQADEIEYELVIIEPWDTDYSLASSSVVGINNLNQVSGGGFRWSGPTQFLWTQSTGKQEIDLAGQINDLGVIASSGVILWADGTIEYFEWPMHGVGEINNSNVIAGSNGSVHTCPHHSGGREAVVWSQEGGPVRVEQDLGVWAADQAWAINESNEIVGVRSSTGECGDQKAFYYNLEPDEYIDLHTIVTGTSSGITHAFDINNAGVVVGDSPPFAWSISDGLSLLPTIDGADLQYTHPKSINNQGVIVGLALNLTDGVWRAVIWDDANGARDLNSLVELPADFIIDEAKKVNDNGWIIGAGHYGTWNPTRAVVLIPIASEMPGDVNRDGSVGVTDLLQLLAEWGECEAPCPPTSEADFDEDCAVGVGDLLTLLGNWS